MIVKNLQEFCQFLKIGHPLVAIDYGQKKIGIAVSNQERTIAMPLRIIKNSHNKTSVQEIINVINNHNICAIVIGLPLHMNGDTTEQTNIVIEFAKNIAKNIKMAIYLQDERLTSRAADNLLKSFDISRKMRNKSDDAIAASMILETTLDAINRFY